MLAGCGSGGLAPHEVLPATPQADDDHGPLPAMPEVGSDPRGTCEVTADNIEGPFYKPGAPARAVLVGDRDRGERLVLGGTVRTTACTPVAGAVLELWQADARGGYDNDGWGLRGTLTTDALGRWQVRTIMPGRYLDGRRYRPMHIHIKLRARGLHALTTQLYFEGDPYLDGDPFVVSSLIMPHARAGSGRRAAFDFVLPAAT
ncbi:MAG: Catechol 1,2-dioxygenase 1 [Deltaproteobacteria bacterium]|nr:Catechol 1,2-dioxygenase 1 [Deltaproteobacteria bacterium]